MTPDDDLGVLASCAVRYALGRRTYIVSAVADAVRRHLAAIPTRDLALIARDVEEGVAIGDAGDPCDEVVWRQLVTDVAEEMARRAKEGGEG